MFNKKNGVAGPQETTVTETAVCNTKIGKGIVMVGDFEGSEPIEVNGTIEGNIVSSSVVHVSKDGIIKGTGKIQNINVSGTLDGDFTCENAANFTSSGTMKGKLTTKELVTETGTSFCGTLNLMANIQEKQADKPAE